MNTLCIVLLVSLTGYVRIVAVNEACGDPTPACDDGHYCEDSKCKRKAGMTCSEGPADQCIKGATCKNTKCECGANHTANAEKTMCQLKIHQNCSAAGFMCMMGTTCKEQTCMCPEKSGPNTAMDKCLKYIEETCVTMADCVEGDTYHVVCDTDKKCACEPMYAANDMMNMCKLKLNETCSADVDCGMNAMCSTGTDKRCACKANFVNEENRCESGSAAVVASLLLLVAALVTSRLM